MALAIEPKKIYWKNAEGSALASDNLFLGNEGIIVPSGTTLQRPSAPVNGTFRYNTDNQYIEIYQNGTWTASVGSLLGTSNQIVATTVGFTTTLSIAANPVIPGAIGMVVPVGGNADETGITDGTIRYNSDVGQFRGRANGAWVNITDNWFVNPMTTRGDFVKGGVGGIPMRLALGSANSFLISNGTDPVWGVPSTLDGVTIGSISPAPGTFSTLVSTGQTSLGGATGSESLRVINVSSAANYIQIAGAASNNSPTIQAAGLDSDIPLKLFAKGNERLYLGTNSGDIQIAVPYVGSPTSYILMHGGSASSNCGIQTSFGNLNISTASGITDFTNFGTATISLADLSLSTDLTRWMISNSGPFKITATNDSINAFTDAYVIGRGTTYNVTSHTWNTSTVAGTPVQGMQLTSSGLATGRLTITADGNADGLIILGRSSDGYSLITAKSNDGLTLYGGFRFGSTGAVDIRTGSTLTIQASFIHTASANNTLTFTGSNGGNPTIGVSGGELNFSAGARITSSNFPFLRFITTSAATDSGVVSIFSDSGIGDLKIQFQNDLNNASTAAYVISRGTTYNVASHTWYTSTVAGTANQQMKLNTDGGLSVAGGAHFGGIGDFSGGVHVSNATNAGTLASTVILEQQNSTTSRMIVRGPDASTNGIYVVNSQRSDGSNPKSLTLLDASGNTTLPGNLNLQDNILQNAKLKKYTMSVNALASIAGATTIDLTLGNVVSATATGAVVWTVTNAPASGTFAEILLVLSNGGIGTQTWMSGTKWPGGTAPTLQSAGMDVISFFTIDGGTTWHGSLTQGNSS